MGSVSQNAFKILERNKVFYQEPIITLRKQVRSWLMVELGKIKPTWATASFIVFCYDFLQADGSLEPLICSLNSSILYFNLLRKNCITEVNSFTGSGTIEENICSWISYVLVLYYYSVQSYNKRFINRVCLCHTEKYRTLVFQHSPRKLGLYEDHGPVFLSMALAPG